MFSSLGLVERLACVSAILGRTPTRCLVPWLRRWWERSRSWWDGGTCRRDFHRPPDRTIRKGFVFWPSTVITAILGRFWENSKVSHSGTFNPTDLLRSLYPNHWVFINGPWSRWQLGSFGFKHHYWWIDSRTDINVHQGGILTSWKLNFYVKIFHLKSNFQQQSSDENTLEPFF